MVEILYAYVFPYINFAIFIACIYYFGHKPFALYIKGKAATYRDAAEKGNKAYAVAKKDFVASRNRLSALDEEIKTIKSKFSNSMRVEREELFKQRDEAVTYLQKEAQSNIVHYQNKQVKEFEQELWQLVLTELDSTLNKSASDKGGEKSILPMLKAWQAGQVSRHSKGGGA